MFSHTTHIDSKIQNILKLYTSVIVFILLVVIGYLFAPEADTPKVEAQTIGLSTQTQIVQPQLSSLQPIAYVSPTPISGLAQIAAKSATIRGAVKCGETNTFADGIEVRVINNSTDAIVATTITSYVGGDTFPNYNYGKVFNIASETFYSIKLWDRINNKSISDAVAFNEQLLSVCKASGSIFSNCNFYNQDGNTIQNGLNFSVPTSFPGCIRPTNTPTRVPTATPTRFPTKVPTATPTIVFVTEVPTIIPSVSVNPKPTKVVTPTATIKPTSTLTPTNTPTATIKPTISVKPTITPTEGGAQAGLRGAVVCSQTRKFVAGVNVIVENVSTANISAATTTADSGVGLYPQYNYGKSFSAVDNQNYAVYLTDWQGRIINDAQAVNEFSPSVCRSAGIRFLDCVFKSNNKSIVQNGLNFVLPETSSYCSGPTVTPQITLTPTVGVTPTLTITPANTIVPTTIVPTNTITPTTNITVTPSATVGPTSTINPSQTTVPTLNPTIKPTATLTPTVTVVPTASSTIVPTVTNQPTNTPTLISTPTATLVNSPTPTATFLPTAVPTNTAQPTPTATFLPTAVPTNTIKPSATATVLPTSTINPTNTSTPTLTPVATMTPTVTMTPTSRPSLTPVPTATPKVSPTVRPSVVPTPTTTIRATVSPTIRPNTTVNPTTRVSITPTTVVPSGFVSINLNKKADKNGYVIGDTIVFEITIKNTGSTGVNILSLEDNYNENLIRLQKIELKTADGKRNLTDEYFGKNYQEVDLATGIIDVEDLTIEVGDLTAGQTITLITTYRAAGVPADGETCNNLKLVPNNNQLYLIEVNECVKISNTDIPITDI